MRGRRMKPNLRGQGAMGTTRGTEDRPSGKPRPQRTFSPASYDRRVQIAAAQARVTLDKRLHIKTPQWIIDLANEEPRTRS